MIEEKRKFFFFSQTRVNREQEDIERQKILCAVNREAEEKIAIKCES